MRVWVCIPLLCAACGGEPFSGAEAIASSGGAAGAAGGAASSSGAGGSATGGSATGGVAASAGAAGAVATGCVDPARAMPAAANGELVLAVTDDDDPQSPALDANDVYWVTATSVWSVPKQGGCMKRLAAGGTRFESLVQRDGVLYFVDAVAGEVRRVSVSGEGAMTVSTGQSQVHGVAADDAYVYWTGDGMLRRRSRDGSGPVEEVTTDAVASAHSLAVDDTHVYWATRTGSVYRTSKSGGTATQLDSVSGLTGGDAVRLVLFENRFYWSFRTAGAGGVRTRIKTGTAASLSAIADGPVAGITVDGAFAYWGRAQSAGGVRKGPAALGSVSDLVAGQSKPSDVVVDDSFVYWTNSGDASLRRADK